MIDEIMNTVGEIVITQSMLSQLGSSMEGPLAEQLRSGLAQLERNVRELQEGVMRVRMLPISFVFSRFPRMVRDLSHRLGKEIELKLTGDTTELDKTVLEKIGDPLVHLRPFLPGHGHKRLGERDQVPLVTDGKKRASRGHASIRSFRRPACRPRRLRRPPGG